MTVRQLTLEQKDLIAGTTYDGEQFFNPTLDANGNWFISNEEVNNYTGDLEWVATLPEIDYNPVVVEMPQN